MTIADQEEEIVARECRFSVHVPRKTPQDEDWHIVKEIVHFKSGRSECRLRALKNYTRPMWITKPHMRNHKEKKETEHVNNLLTKKVIQSDLRTEIAKALGKAWSREGIRELCASPYVYGTDVPSTCIIKQILYRKLWPNKVTPFSVCTFDTETSMFDEDGTIIVASCAFKNNVLLIVRKDQIEGYSDPVSRFNAVCNKYLYERYAKDGKLPFEIEFFIADDEISIVKEAFKRIHAWKPDFLAIWNLDFDVTKVLGACKRAGIDPEDILCDPSLPKHMRRCYYKRGQVRQVTASGKSKPLAPSAQWHTLFLTASFYVICAMASYRLLRLSKQELPDYGLDTVLKANKLGGKFSFKEADGYEKDALHKFMQSKHIFEYLVYAIGDAWEMIALENKTKDLQSTLPGHAASTDFYEFNSQPKRLRNAMFWDFMEKHQRVVGTVGPKKKIEVVEKVVDYDGDGFDDEDMDEGDDMPGEDMHVLDRRGWVLTLHSHLNVPGLKLIKGEPFIDTLIRAFTYDSDAVSAYPRCVIVSNYSKATTRKEPTRIRGIDESVFRLQNLNMVLGNVNANDYGRTMMGLPRSRQLFEDFMKDTA